MRNNLRMIQYIKDDLNVEPENADEKAKRFAPVVEPTLETPEQVEISDQDRLR